MFQFSTSHNTKGIVVFSGGSAANALVNVFSHITDGKPLSYVIPISDNGGSTSEIIRFIGGPGIGDLRSRLVRLIPDDSDDPERHAIRTFFNHRLSSDKQSARLEWLDLVEARHDLWHEISSPKRELIRSFLNLLNMEIVKRTRPSSVFSFQGASVGNLFLTGARLFCGSLESSIYLLSSICSLPSNIAVLPAINTNFTHHICAGLANGDTIPGQNAISHPSDPSKSVIPTSAAPSAAPSPSIDPRAPWPAPHPPTIRLDPTPLNLPITHPPSTQIAETDETDTADSIEDANLPGSLPTLRKQYLTFSKAHVDGESDLPARISRIWYINPYGQEIRPAANPKTVEAIASTECIIYSIGSLYTSIIPSIILRGIGDAIARRAVNAQKILILNGTLDRESGPSTTPFTGLDFVRAIARAGLESRGIYDREADVSELRDYVTHLVYIEGEGTPKVDREGLAEAGIEAIRVYGRRAQGDGGRGCYYDEKALTQALQAVIGGRAGGRREHARRNTLLS